MYNKNEINKKNKYIFLDIDWVLNRFSENKEVNRSCLNSLLYILNRTNAKIIISSDWKYDEKDLKRYFDDYNIPDYIWITEKWLETWLSKEFDNGIDLEWIREKEIKIYLNHLNKKNINYNYVIIDDMPLKWFWNNFVKTDQDIWLNRELAEKAIKILNKE